MTDVFGSDFDFPSLNTLTFPVSPSYGLADTVFEMFTSSTNHPPSTVKFMTLLQPRGLPQPVVISLKQLLDELESIERITCLRELLAYILKFLLEANMQREGSRVWSNILGRSLELVDPATGSVARLVFDKTMCDTDICTAGRILHAPDLMLPWDEFEDDLHSNENVFTSGCRT